MNLTSVVVCTRNRPEMLRRVVRSLLASEGVELEVIVIDQSDGPETAQLLAQDFPDPRLRLSRSKVKGKGAALNEALDLVHGEIIVLTDDDCEAEPNWVAGMARTLREQPSVAVVFCAVVAPVYDYASGYIPVFDVKHSRLLRSLAGKWSPLGMGAGMAVRRQAVLAVGGFDEAVGPGGRFPSCDDWDIAMRTLLHGWHVFETSELYVTHHGFRSATQGREHQRRDWFAIGAVCTKPLRAGHLSAALLPVCVFSRHAVWPPIIDLLHLRRPRGWARISGFFAGIAEGCRTPMDNARLMFAKNSSEQNC